MLYQNIVKQITDEASKLLVSTTLGIKTNYSPVLCKYYLLNYKLSKYEE